MISVTKMFSRSDRGHHVKDAERLELERQRDEARRKVFAARAELLDALGRSVIDDLNHRPAQT